MKINIREFYKNTIGKWIPEYYEGGVFLRFRLSVEDYHRYCYIDKRIFCNGY